MQENWEAETKEPPFPEGDGLGFGADGDDEQLKKAAATWSPFPMFAHLYPSA